MPKLGLFHRSNKDQKPLLSEESKRDIVDIAILLFVGFPSLAMVVAGGTGTFLGGLMLITPGPHQPLALPVLAVSLPATGIGGAVAAVTTAYEMDDGIYYD